MADIDFDIAPEFELVRTERRRAVRSNADQGVVLVREVNEQPVRIYTLNWSGAPSILLQSIRSKFRESLGGVLAMNYTPEEVGSAIEVRFAENTLTTIEESAVVGSTTVVLEEVL